VVAEVAVEVERGASFFGAKDGDRLGGYDGESTRFGQLLCVDEKPCGIVTHK
jgi:hypothetical protein